MPMTSAQLAALVDRAKAKVPPLSAQRRYRRGNHPNALCRHNGRCHPTRLHRLGQRRVRPPQRQ
jgi:hypothetical protein